MEDEPLPATSLMNEAKEFVYLAGAMDAAPDYGTRWRVTLEAFFSKLGITCFNPCCEEEMLLGLSSQDLMALREKDRARYVESIKRLVARDLEVIRTRTRCVVAYLDDYAKAGTYGEVIFAYSQGVPVYIISALPEEHVPGWILACVTKIFFSIEECIDFFKRSVSG